MNNPKDHRLWMVEKALPYGQYTPDELPGVLYAYLFKDGISTALWATKFASIKEQKGPGDAELGQKGLIVDLEIAGINPRDFKLYLNPLGKVITGTEPLQNGYYVSELFEKNQYLLPPIMHNQRRNNKIDDMCAQTLIAAEESDDPITENARYRFAIKPPHIVRIEYQSFIRTLIPALREFDFTLERMSPDGFCAPGVLGFDFVHKHYDMRVHIVSLHNNECSVTCLNTENTSTKTWVSYLEAHEIILKNAQQCADMYAKKHAHKIQNTLEQKLFEGG